MSTEKQERALEKMVENGGVASQAMLDVGYSANTAKTPQKLTDSKGFKELCEDSGLTDTFLIESLIDDIKTKKGNRKAELELGFKIKGRLVQKTDITSNEKPIPISNIITFEDYSKIDQALDNILTRCSHCSELLDR